MKLIDTRKDVAKMSLTANLINVSLKLSGIKKMYYLPDEQFLEKVKKMNKSRGFYMPKDKKAFYKEHNVLGYKCLIVQQNKEPATRSILYMFGGGMLLGPDKGDIDVIVKLVQKTGCDIWFPIYPLCPDHCITESFEMVFECYRQMINLYGGGNVSTCGFSSGAALALGIASYNNTLSEKLPMPRHIVAVSPGEVPWNEDEIRIMKQNNPKDNMVDYAFMSRFEKFQRKGRNDIPEYMIHISKGDFSGVDNIHFVYSEDEVLYGAKQNFIDACKKYNVKYTVRQRKGMFHCYTMLPYFREAKEDFNEIADILRN